MLFGAQAMGTADKLKGLVEQCMAEYDLDGWKVPDLTNPGDLSYHANGHAAPSAPASVAPVPPAQPAARPAGAGSPVLGGDGGGFRNPFATK